MDQLIIGILLVLIILGAGWLLMVYNRLVNLISLEAQQRRSIEKYHRIRQQYMELPEVAPEEWDAMNKKMKELDQHIEAIKMDQRKTIKDFHGFCRSTWVKPALFLMGMKQAVHKIQEPETMSGKRK